MNGTSATVRAIAGAALAAALLTACGGGHKSADAAPSASPTTAAPTGAVPTAPAVQTPDLPGMSADCRSMTALISANTAAHEDSLKLLGVALLADKDARVMKDDKKAIATRGLATYDREQAAHLKSPSNPTPETALMTAFITAYATCAK